MIAVQPDGVDHIVEQWGRERPDLDVAGMAIIGRISRLEQEVRPRLNGVFAAHGLESWEFDVLATLLRSGSPHQLTPGQLLESMMITSGAMTNRLDRLQARGYIERIKSPDDGRKVLVTLTPAGCGTVSGALVDHVENQQRMVASLSQGQRDRLVDLLRALHHALADDPG